VNRPRITAYGLHKTSKKAHFTLLACKVRIPPRPLAQNGSAAAQKQSKKIVSESPDGETLTYCFEIRQMLTDAGYPNEAQEFLINTVIRPILY
jgi:hypothetical protein